jgi:hypothetical protein
MEATCSSERSTYYTRVISQKTELFITTAVRTSNPTWSQNSWSTDRDLKSFPPGYESRSLLTLLRRSIFGVMDRVPPRAAAVSIASSCRSGCSTLHKSLSVWFGRFILFRNIFCLQSELHTLFYLALLQLYTNVVYHVVTHMATAGQPLVKHIPEHRFTTIEGHPLPGNESLNTFPQHTIIVELLEVVISTIFGSSRSCRGRIETGEREAAYHIQQENDRFVRELIILCWALRVVGGEEKGTQCLGV